jgi:hypothetical protein
MATNSFLGTYAKQQEEGYNSTMTKYLFFSRLSKGWCFYDQSISHQCHFSYDQLQWESQLNPWPSDEGPRPKSGKFNWSRPKKKKELKGELMIWRTKMQARVQGIVPTQGFKFASNESKVVCGLAIKKRKT